MDRRDRFRKSRFLPMAADAGALTAGHEVVGLMAAYARTVIGRARARGLRMA
jgi:hypothetical protein